DPRLHRGDAIADKLRFAHQAGAESAAFHALGGATDIEIDFVIAKIGAYFRRLRQQQRIGPAELQGDGMLRRIKAQQAGAVPKQDRGGSKHLGIKPRAVRQDAMEDPAMPVRPIHHRRHAKAISAVAGSRCGAACAHAPAIALSDSAAQSDKSVSRETFLSDTPSFSYIGFGQKRLGFAYETAISG